MLPEILQEAIEWENARFKRLAVRLLDDSMITEEAYKALLDVMPKEVTLQLNREVIAADEMVWLPKEHSLKDWFSCTK